jgi:hypothetical protein
VTHPVMWLSGAEVDFVEAATYYADIRPELGEAMVHCLSGRDSKRED